MTTARVDLDGDDVVIDDEKWGPEPDDRPPFTRLAYAAAHVVMRDDYATAGHTLDRPGTPDDILHWIDWDQTAAQRRWLASHGFGIAEAMDTAQRFMIGWPAAERLIHLCADLDLPAGFAAGASTDHAPSIDDEPALAEAVAHQCRVIAEAGGLPVILPMAHLVRWGADEDAFVRVYADVLARCDGPVLLHWLGPMFVPALEGYFPGRSLERVLEAAPDRVRGLKISMLDDVLEIRLRRAMLPRRQLMLTGDDFNFAPLIEGDDAPTALVDLLGRDVPIGDFSHALLGILDGIAAPAARALRELARGNHARYREIMAPCQALSRVVFEDPTRHYKAGLAFLAWLDGRQSNPMLVNREDLARPREHLRRVAIGAAHADVFEHAGTAAERLERWSRT